MYGKKETLSRSDRRYQADAGGKQGGPHGQGDEKEGSKKPSKENDEGKAEDEDTAKVGKAKAEEAEEKTRRLHALLSNRPFPKK